MTHDRSDQPRRRKYQTIQSDVEGYTRIKHVYIHMRDGVELCANIFLPFSASKHGEKVPVICTLGAYGKDVHATKFGLPNTPMYSQMFKHIRPLGPDACFELCEPMIWCREFGYALLRADMRGIGGSQGRLDPLGLERSVEIQADAEGQDLYDLIEWAAVQPWSSGKVAIFGNGFHGMIGYWAAMQKPPHLTCVLSYESGCDLYQICRRGGINGYNFALHWFYNMVLPYQAGKQDGSLTEEELAANRVDYVALQAKSEYPTEGVWAVLNRVRKLSDIEVPFYLAGNWTDTELHLPGNIRAFNSVSSKYKWLEMHTGNHLGPFYEPSHIELQRKFLDYFLFDKKDNGMLDVPRIRLLQHHGTGTFYRENEIAFPIPDAEDVSFYLTPDKRLSLTKPTGPRNAFSYQGFKENLNFTLDSPFSESFECLGSPYLELEVVTEAPDLDLFVYLRAHDCSGANIVLRGSIGEPMDSFARGYFRLSHRDEVAKDFKKEKVLIQPAVPRSEVVRGQVYSVLVPLYPTAFLFDHGQSLSMEIGSVNTGSTMKRRRHDNGDRLPERFEGENVIFSHGRLVLPRVKR